MSSARLLASFVLPLAASAAVACANDMGPGTGSGGGPSATGGAGVGGALPSGGGPSSGGGFASGGAGTGGAGTGGAVSSGGAPPASGGSSTGGALGSGGEVGTGELGSGDFEGEGMSDMQYHTAEVSRDGVPYLFITNGWGPGFDEHTHTWLGTSFVVQQMEGSAGQDGEPATYPSMFCGRYSIMQVPDCGLPAARSSLTSVRTGFRWKSNGNDAGQYNAAYDIWLGSEQQFQMYFMVWLRDPTNFQPAGMAIEELRGVTVANVPGTWDIWEGEVLGSPIVNYVVPEGVQLTELEFDVLDFLADAEARGFSLPPYLRAVAIGFEIWEGPIAGLTAEDFYVHVE